jgi:hypothetical protein
MPSKTRRNKKNSQSAFLIVAILSVGAVAALAQYVRQGHDHVPPAEHRQEDGGAMPSPIHVPVTRNDSTTETPSGTTAYVYTPVWKGASVDFTKAQIVVPQGQDAKVFAVNQYLQNTKINPDAQLLSIDIHAGTAAMYFNQAMDRTFGSDDETMLLNGICTTMGQFSGIDKLEFFANGKKIDSFGNVDLSSPVPVMKAGRAEASTRSEAQQP